MELCETKNQKDFAMNMHFMILFGLFMSLVVHADSLVAQRGGRGGRGTPASESATAAFQIPGLPAPADVDCKDWSAVSIPIRNGDQYTKIEFRSAKMMFLIRMLSRLTGEQNPITYDANKNQLTIKVSKEFNGAGTIEVPLYPAGKGPEGLRVSTHIQAQAERLIVAALLERMPAQDRKPLKITDPENGNGLELTDQKILKAIDVLRALRGGASLPSHTSIIYLSIRKSLLRLTASTHPPLEYKIDMESDPKDEFHRIINSFYTLKVPPFLGKTKN